MKKQISLALAGAMALSPCSLRRFRSFHRHFYF